jgi:hypothetical protein
MEGACKKAMEPRMPLEYEITKEYPDMVAQLVQDHTIQDCDNAKCQRDKIEEQLAYMQNFLQQLKEAQVVDNNIGTIPSTLQI